MPYRRNASPGYDNKKSFFNFAVDNRFDSQPFFIYF